MSGKTSRAALVLTAAEEEMLGGLARSRTAPVREAERAKVLLAYAEKRSMTEVIRRVGVGGSTVCKCIDKAMADGVAAGLKDACHRPYASEMTEEAKAWVVSLACTKPKDHGRAAEVWSISALAEFVSSHVEEAGHPRLAQTGKSTVWRILNERQIKPHKIRHDLERRDPEFDRKMQEVLMVYQEVALYREGAVHDARPHPIYAVSVDEKVCPHPQTRIRGSTSSSAPSRSGSLIRVTKIRIRQGINEMNAAPVVFRWKKPDLAMA